MMKHRVATMVTAILMVLAIVICVGSGLFDSVVTTPSPSTPTGDASLFPAPATVTDLPRIGITPRATSAVPTTGMRGLYVEPDDGRSPVLDEIGAARETIDLTIYLITDAKVIDALGQAAARGVKVRVILEEHPFGGSSDQDVVAAKLRNAGISVRWGDSRFRFTHAKYMVVDQQVALITTQNLSTSSFTANREFGVVTTVPADVEEASRIFASDWAGNPAIARGPLVVSPDNSRGRLTALIDGATTSIDLYAEVIRDPAMAAALTDAARRGVRVRVLITHNKDEGNLEAAAKLTASGVEVRMVKGLYIHAKMILVDGERAFVGSENLTATSLDANRELGLVISEPPLIKRSAAIFRRDWSQAIPFEQVAR